MFEMFEAWAGLFLILGIAAFALDILLWLQGCWYWFWHQHRADRATYETTVNRTPQMSSPI